jgi:hypothetical protein
MLSRVSHVGIMQFTAGRNSACFGSIQAGLPTGLHFFTDKTGGSSGFSKSARRL